MTTADLWAEAAPLAGQLAETLAGAGVLRSSEWDRAIRSVPRHLFVPNYVEQRPDGTWRTVSGDDLDTHSEWLAAVYSDRPLTTALRIDSSGQPVAISSSSKPGLMVRMLEALELDDDHRVLEIGTGTGYNAGLLACRLGDGQVASVDIEPDLVEAAAGRLALLGMAPRVVATDGATGLPGAAPFDRIIATCSVSSIPMAWVGQLSSRGRILTDLKITGAAGNLVDLRSVSGGQLEGRFLPKWAGFMPLRSQVESASMVDRLPQTEERLTTTPSANPWWDHQVVWFLAALTLPSGITTGVRLDPNTMTPTATTMQAADGSWVEVTLGADDGGHREVCGSSGDLWSAVENAYELWRELGEPGWDAFGLTVSGIDQRVWFDAPTSQHIWALSPGGNG